jgi:hypothetical protein
MMHRYLAFCSDEMMDTLNPLRGHPSIGPTGYPIHDAPDP